MQGRLGDVALFRRLTPEQREHVAGLGRMEEFDAGQIIFDQGDPARCLYVVDSGRLRVDRRFDDGDWHELLRVGPGGVVGEAALFDDAPRVARVTTLEPSRLFRLERGPFVAFASGSPEILGAALGGLSEVLRASYEQFFSQVLERQALHAALEAERCRSLAQMVAGVAHEINTPLGVTTTAASVVTDNLAGLRRRRGDWSDPAVDDCIEAATLMQRSLARANSLVQSFKSLSVRQAVDHVEEVELGALVREVITVYSPQARAEHLDVILRDERADPEARWMGSPSQLAQVLLNLLTNAGHHAYPEEVGGRVEVVINDAPGDGDGLALTVRDFGQGISPIDRPRVLEPFFTTGRERGGTGLGLAIVNTLVTDAMGGKLEIDSAPGRGTAVRVTLPRRPS